jgi:hypothetical protein
MEGCVYPIPYKYSKYLFYSSFLMLLSFIFALYFNEGYVSIYFFLLFLTSINFWRKPEYGLRRNLDKMLVYFGVIYTLFYIYLLSGSFYKIMFLNMFICVLVFHITEYILCYFNSTKWIIFHMTMHLYVSSMVLFVFFI